MKCIFCNEELISGHNPETLICPKCHVHVYMNSKVAMPGKDSPKWLRDSFLTLLYLQKYRPDIVYGACGLFVTDFDIYDTTWLFSKRNAAMSVNASLRASYYTKGRFSEDIGELIAFKGVLTYRFIDTLEASLGAMPKCRQIPLITSSQCSPDRLLWHIIVCCNITDDTGRSGVVNTLCQPTMYNDGSVILSDVQAAAVAGYHRFMRMREISCSDGNWEEAVNCYIQKMRNITITAKDYAEMIRKASPKVENSGSVNMLCDVVRAYLPASPALYLSNVDDNICLFDPECAVCVDTTPLDVCSGSMYLTEAGRYEVYSQLWCSLFSQKDYPSAPAMSQLLGGKDKCPSLEEVLSQ